MFHFYTRLSSLVLSGSRVHVPHHPAATAVAAAARLPLVSVPQKGGRQLDVIHLLYIQAQLWTDWRDEERGVKEAPSGVQELRAQVHTRGQERQGRHARVRCAVCSTLPIDLAD